MTRKGYEPDLCAFCSKKHAVSVPKVYPDPLGLFCSLLAKFILGPALGAPVHNLMPSQSPQAPHFFFPCHRISGCFKILA